MRRGEVWTVAGGRGYANKPRPAVIVQDNAFAHLPSITICPISSSFTHLPPSRIVLEPTAENGLLNRSAVLTDKITTLEQDRVGKHIGKLSDEDMSEIGLALSIFLGLAE